MALNSLIQSALETVDLEIVGAVQLLDEKLIKFKSLALITWANEPMFVNASTLVCTHPEDAQSVRLIPGMEPVFKIEVQEYNYYIYGFRFLNCKIVSEILLDANSESGIPNMEATE